MFHRKYLCTYNIHIGTYICQRKAIFYKTVLLSLRNLRSGVGEVVLNAEMDNYLMRSVCTSKPNFSDRIKEGRRLIFKTSQLRPPQNDSSNYIADFLHRVRWNMEYQRIQYEVPALLLCIIWIPMNFSLDTHGNQGWSWNHTLLCVFNTWLCTFNFKASQPCHEMIQRCIWEDEELACHEIFHPIITELGVCCTFNMMPLSLLLQ